MFDNFLRYAINDFDAVGYLRAQIKLWPFSGPLVGFLLYLSVYCVLSDSLRN
jgi:hypothetical protein